MKYIDFSGIDEIRIQRVENPNLPHHLNNNFLEPSSLNVHLLTPTYLCNYENVMNYQF